MQPTNSGDLARAHQHDLMREAAMERLAAEVTAETAETADLPRQQAWLFRVVTGALDAVLHRSTQRREARVARKVVQPAGVVPGGSRTARR